MFGKVILFVYAIQVSNAVVIHSSENYNKDLVKTNPRGWQMVKVYHPPQAFGYKYESYAYPKYEFEYSVSDKNTGDHKYHSEARDGDRVRGEYSLVESDGSLRKVQYHADDHNGFNAVVSRTVNQHGNHAVSVSDHTRYFYPVGHNVKINHYFPGKDYQYQEIESEIKYDDKISKPVHEKAVVINKDVKMVLTESLDKLDARDMQTMAVEPIKFEEVKESDPKEEEIPTIVANVTETEPIQVVPTVESMTPTKKDDNKANDELISSTSLGQKSEISLAKEIPSENESKKLDKEDNSDSEVASSFYTSKYYYIIQ